MNSVPWIVTRALVLSLVTLLSGFSTVKTQVVIHPVSINLTSDPVSPLSRVGSNVAVICTVELSPVMDIPVTVQIQLTDPTGGLLTTETPSTFAPRGYTTRALINSIRRDQAGIYTCKITLMISSPWVQNIITSETINITFYSGIQLALKGKTYGNNSLFFFNEIGRTNVLTHPLQCITDRERCCQSPPNRFGEWYFPNGSLIPVEYRGDTGYAKAFYRNRGDGTVSLNRANDSVVSPSGRYCCQLPNAADVYQTLCANIVAVQIRENIAPQIGLSNYTLTCTTSGAETPNVNMTYRWFKAINSRSRDPVGTNTSVLLFSSPLKRSNTGNYTCEVSTVRKTQNSAQNVTIKDEASWVVLVESHSIIVTANGDLSLGQTYTLACSILPDSGLEEFDLVINYRWIKDNGTRMQVETSMAGTTSSVLSFSPLQLSDAGSYTCEVTANLNHVVKILNRTTFHFEVPIPQPSVSLVSNASSPVLSGSSPILLCIVELHPAVDVPVDLNILWTSPHGSTLTSNLVTKSPSLYTSKVVLNDIGLADAGIYTCSVNIISTILSVQKDIQIGDAVFQLRLKYTDDCRMWYKSSSGEMEIYKYYIEETLIEAIKLRCECHFPRENLLQESFSCSSSPHLTTYRNTLIGTSNVNAAQLVGFIQDWVNSGPKITIKSYSVWVDKKCPVAVSSFDEPECGE